MLSHIQPPRYTFCRVAMFPLPISDGMRAYSHYYEHKDYKGPRLGYNMSAGASHQTDWVTADSTPRSAITITPNVILEAIENQ